MMGAARSLRATETIPTRLIGFSSLSLIIFPQYLPGGDFTTRSLSKAETGLELMQCLINARNLPEHGFPEVVRLAKRVPTDLCQF